MPEQSNKPSVLQMFLLAEVKSMSMLLDQRLGESSPWRDVEFSNSSLSELNIAKKLMQELLYVPPNRAR